MSKVYSSSRINTKLLNKPFDSRKSTEIKVKLRNEVEKKRTKRKILRSEFRACIKERKKERRRHETLGRGRRKRGEN